MVVGAKSDVPFEMAVAVNAAIWLSEGFESRYTKASIVRKKPMIKAYMQTLRHRLDRFVCMYRQSSF